MADGLEGFSPQVQRLLRAAGINLSVGAGVQRGLSGSPVWGRDLAPSAQEASTAPWYQLRKQTGIDPEGWLTDPGNQAVNAARTGVKPVPESVQKLLDQVLKARQIEADQGRPDTAPHRNLLLRGLDYLGRPGAAVMGAITETARDAMTADAGDGSESGGSRLAEILGGIGVKAGAKTSGDVTRGAKRGFTAEERYYGSKLLDEAGVQNRAVRAVGGFGLDVVTDPLSYVSFGTVKAAGTAASAAARRAAVREGADAAVAGGARMPADELVKHLTAPKSRGPITAQAIDLAAQDVGRQAATAARSSLANDLARVGMPTAKAKQAAVRWLNPAARLTPAATLEKETWLAKLRASPDVVPTYLDRSAAAIQAEAHAATHAQLTALHAENAAAEARRMLTVKLGRTPLVEGVPIPHAVTASAARIGTFPGARQAVAAFDRTFNTGTRFDRTLTAAKARTAGVAERRIEAVRGLLVDGFRGTNHDQRKALQEAIVGTPGTMGAGVVKLADGRDAAELVQETYDHVGRYIDWDGQGSGLVSVGDLNRFLPQRFKFDKLSPGPAGSAPGPGDLVAALVRRNAGHLRTADPAQHLYALHIAVEKAVARDQLARAVATFGIPVSPAGRNVLGPDGKMLAATSAAAKELREKHGWSEIITKGRDKELGASYGKHLQGLLFDPATKHGVTRLLAVADDVTKRGEVLRLYDQALGGLKKALTLPSPSFHLRNSFGDLFLGYLDDVSGPRGARSYQQASRTMVAIRTLGKRPELREVLDGAVDPATGRAADPIAALAEVVKAGRREPGPGNRVMRVPKSWPDAPGEHLSAEQIWAAYNHAGLKRGFVSADLEPALHVPRAGMGLPAQAMHGLQELSAQREDYFRLAHFIDRLKRSTAPTFAAAAEDAAAYVRRFHFDYHDVTPTEQAVFARIFPFYKFQRFAAPLMVQMFMARPGKIVNAQRALYGVSDLGGYERDDDTGLPHADQILPDYFQDAAMVPLFDSIRGNTVYGNPGFPSTQIPSQTLGLSGDDPAGVAAGIGQNLVGSVNPLVQAPFELATGRRVFGGGDVPVGPLPQYLAGKTPVTNLAFVGAGKDDADTRWANFLTGLGLSENTPSRQQGALLDELQRIAAQRKKAGYVPAQTGRPGRTGRPESRGG